MNKALLFIAFSSVLSVAHGLTLTGTVTGRVPAQARVGEFVGDLGRRSLTELASAPVTAGGAFSLTLAPGTPPARAQAPLRASEIGWPGVLEPVNVVGRASTSDLFLMVYSDANGNGRRDDDEPLLETPPTVGRAALLLTWMDGPAQVLAARGFEARFQGGLNAQLIEVGRAMRVTPAGERVDGVVLNVQR